MKVKFAYVSFVSMSYLFLGTQASAYILRPARMLSDEYVFNSAAQIIDNSGLSSTLDSGADLTAALSVTHVYTGDYRSSYASTDPGGGSADFFASIGTDTDVDIVLDLTNGGDVGFKSILLWQYENNGGGAGRAGNATRTLELRINTEAQGTNSFSSTPAITLTMLPVVDGDSNPDNDLGGTNSAQGFNIGDQSGRYVLISLTDNHYGLNGMTAGGDRVGLGEVRFATEEIQDVPEPAAYALVLLVSGSFLFFRRVFK